MATQFRTGGITSFPKIILLCIARSADNDKVLAGGDNYNSPNWIQSLMRWHEFRANASNSEHIAMNSYHVCCDKCCI